MIALYCRLPVCSVVSAVQLAQVIGLVTTRLDFKLSDDQSTPLKLYIHNAASIAKRHAVEQLSADLTVYSVDAAIISESHLKKKHPNSCIDIDSYVLFRRDKQRRKDGGVAVYVRLSLKAEMYKPPIAGDDSNYELLWIKVSQGSEMTFIGALYHPPVPIYQTTNLIDFIEATVIRIQLDHEHAHIILAGDLNQLSDTEVIARTGMSSIVEQPTRGNNKLDRIYVSDYEYNGVKVAKSAVTSDHLAIVAYSGDVVRTVGKARCVHTFRKHTAAQNALFLSDGSIPVHIVDLDGDPQREYDRLYDIMTKMLDVFYPLRTVMITSADPPYC